MKHFWIRGLLVLGAAALIPACGGGSSGSGGAKAPNFVIPGPGGSSLWAAGGSSTSGAGGDGGSILIQGQSGSGVHCLGGNLSINTAFKIPPVTVNLGANPLIINSNTTLTPPGTSGIVPGSAPGNATGLHVTGGATLTINPDTGGGGTDTHLTFSNGVLIDSGCIVQMATVAGTNDKVNLHVTSSVFVHAAGANFAAHGLGGGAPVDGGKGGDFKITCIGDVVLGGTVDCIGGSTAAAGNGGNGGTIKVSSSTAVYATGQISSVGGAATGTGLLGGTGGSITLGGLFSGVFSSSILHSFGGSGRTGGGSGGDITFDVTVADTVTSGDLDASGGSALAPGADGGDGGMITLSTNGYNIRVAGSWSTDGGKGTAPGGRGGAGGPVTILQQNKNGASLLTPTQIVTGGMAISADMTATGGSGDGDAKPGGDISITQNLDGIDASLAGLNPLYVVGYVFFDGSGGAGGTSGGSASSIRVNNQLFTAAPQNPGSPSSVGPVFNGTTENEVNIYVKGGKGTTGSGGTGGTIQVYGGVSASNSGLISNAGAPGTVGGSAGAFALANLDLLAGGTPALPDPGAWVSNSGPIQGDGGNGTSGAGGAACAVEIIGHARATNTGTLDTVGGLALSASAGGKGSQFLLAADGTVSSTGGLTSNGGNSNGANGGDAGSVAVNGQSVTHNAPVTLIGGNGTNGGNGGLAYFNSQLGGTVMHGIFTLVPGTGGTPSVGALYKDGVDMPLTSGVGIY